MDLAIRHLLACTAVILTACGESKTPSGTAAIEGETPATKAGATFVEEAKAMAQKALDSVEKVEWKAWKNKLTQADLSQAKKVLDGIDLPAARTKYDELAAALAKKDYVQAEFYAKQFDELMSSDVAGRTIGFLKLKAEKGTDAAVAAVKDYLNTPGLGESSRQLGEKMLVHLQSVEQDQIEGVLCFVVYYAVDSKVEIKGPHGQNMAAILAVAAVTTGFDAYDLHTKEGMELSDAIFKSTGTNKDKATKAWNEIVAASKKGAGALKDGVSSGDLPTDASQGFKALVELGKKILAEKEESGVTTGEPPAKQP
jgi:hypothetical protein